MKWIVMGETYNTETAKRLADTDLEDNGVEVYARLYQTKGGAFFEVSERRLSEDETPNPVHASG